MISENCMTTFYTLIIGLVIFNEVIVDWFQIYNIWGKGPLQPTKRCIFGWKITKQSACNQQRNFGRPLIFGSKVLLSSLRWVTFLPEGVIIVGRVNKRGNIIFLDLKKRKV
jgi:hypothetical protein